MDHSFVKFKLVWNMSPMIGEECTGCTGSTYSMVKDYPTALTSPLLCFASFTVDFSLAFALSIWWCLYCDDLVFVNF